MICTFTRFNMKIDRGMSSFLLLALAGFGLSQPVNLLAGIANFLGGIKYVPPQTGLFATTKTTTTTTAKPDYSLEKKEVVVFNESGWLQPAGSQHRYLVSEEPMDWFTAKYWCIGEGGFLAEIRDEEQQEQVKVLVERQGRRNYWLGLEHGWHRWYTSRASMTYKGWADQHPSGELDRCAAMMAREGYSWANWNCHDQYESGIEFRALCQKDADAADLKQEGTPVFNAVLGTTENKYKATKNEAKSNITSCSMANINLSGGGWIDRYEGVASAEQCHSLCLDKAACRFWSWRGDNRGRRCFLKEKEGRIVSRVGAFSGTTSRSLGCNQPLARRESRAETCACVPEVKFVESGYIHPRLAPHHANPKRSPREAKNISALLNGQDSSEIGSLLNGKDNATPAILGRIVNEPQDASKSTTGQVCPSGYTLSCTDEDDIILEAKFTTTSPVFRPVNPHKVTTASPEIRPDFRPVNPHKVTTASPEIRPDFRPVNTHKVTTSRPVINQLHITACVVNDVRLSGSSVVSRLEGVTSSATCHAHCLANPLCTYWTWGGKVAGDKCLLSRSEGKVVRRAGAAAGTVAKAFNCDHPIVDRLPEVEAKRCSCEGKNRKPKHNIAAIVNPRESPRGRIVNIEYTKEGCPPCEEEVTEKEVELVCSCKLDPEQDLVGNGKIHPRKLQRGRIVNEEVAQVGCPAGYKLDCEEFLLEEGSGVEDDFLPICSPELGCLSHEHGNYGDLFGIDQYSAPRQGRSKQDNSAVSFPNV